MNDGQENLVLQFLRRTDQRLDRIDNRLDRIERRLELQDARA